MHLKYFGTAAAEGIPGMFCTCPVCENARKIGGKEIRTRSQALVDGKLLIDFPPDTYLHCLRDGLDLPSITALLLTHSHQDHLYAPDLANRKLGFAHVGEYGVYFDEPFRIYATAKAMETVRRDDWDQLEERGITQLHEIEAFKPFQVDDFTVTALTADHNPLSGPVFWIIQRNGKTMLYGNDTGYFPEESWDYLANANLKFDFVSLDCTGMVLPGYRRGHMALPSNEEVRDRMIGIDCADGNTIFCAHHFSHNGKCNHEELAGKGAEIGFLVSYDGMEISF